jgi:hypothetical protein
VRGNTARSSPPLSLATRVSLQMQAPPDLPAAQQAELMERIDAMQVRDR